jgi:hypothetical protein
MSRGRATVCLVVVALAPMSLRAQRVPTTLMSFADTVGWVGAPSDGVRLVLQGDRTVSDQALRFDFDFQGHAGYAVARHAFSLAPLPPHWAMTLHVRGDAPSNTLEIKFVDSSGQNVWWMRRLALTPSREGTTLRFRPSDLSFAWGPLGGGPPRSIAALEIAITAGTGGRGWIALDHLTLIPLPAPVADTVRPRVTASSSARGTSVSAILSSDFARPPNRREIAPRVQWRSVGDGEQQITLDFGGPRELSGLALDWDPGDWAADYDVQRSDDGSRWTTVREVRGAAGGRRFVHLPELETSWLRLALRRSHGGRGYGLTAIRLLSDSVARTQNAFLETVSAAEPAGNWPRAFTHQQSYWTVLGLPRDERDASISEDGSIDSQPGSFSLEPFLFADGKLLTWRDGHVRHALDRGWRPIPEVTRETGDLDLKITALATGTPGHSIVWAQYRVINRRATPRAARLSVAIRPVQVNPPWQFLGVPGGAASIHKLEWNGRAFTVNDTDVVVAVSPGAVAGATTFDAGNVVDALRTGSVPSARLVTDPTELASGAMQWTISLRSRDSADVWIAMPAERADTSILNSSAAATAIDAARHIWDRELGSLEIDLPGSGAAIARTLRTSLANVMINSRGSALQPGTRSYRRSWIRDGALTSAALLRLGHATDVRAFLDWYAPFLFADGKAPCCVDARGADPVAENDSDGEFLFLAAEYLRFTHDTQTVVRHWAALARTAAHLDSLRQTRRTSLYQSPESLLVFGLLPPSISHEGYSAKPAYSYWDDWWGVRGMSDAAMLAGVAGDTARASRFNRSAKEFRADVVASVARAMRVHRMTVMPGAADLGDFDPTSSTIALEPAQALDALPRAVVAATFDSAWANFRHRRDADNWDVYTPYEWRQVGSFIRLGQPERAHALADWFMATRRPAEWNEWSEAIWRNARAPKFIGDMPHGWVASDFIRATLDVIAYERESDSTLVVGAGIPLDWARSSTGVTARGIRTWWGTLALTMHTAGNVVRITVDGVQPPGGIVLRAPFGRSPRSVRVNGKTSTLSARRELLVRAPAVVELEY